jgi:hypothetical protein
MNGMTCEHDYACAKGSSVANDRVPRPPRRNGDDCTVIEVKDEGNRVSWHVKCADARGTVDGEGSAQYSGGSFTGSTVFTPQGERVAGRT